MQRNHTQGGNSACRVLSQEKKKAARANAHAVVELRKEFVNSPVLALCVWDRVCVWGRHPLSCMHDPQNITSHCNRGPKHSHPLLPWHTTATQHILARQNTYQARNVYMMWDDVSGKDFHCGRVCCTAKHQNNVFSLEINNYHHIRRLKSWNKIPNASFFFCFASNK